MEKVSIVIKEPNTGNPHNSEIEHRMTIPVALLPDVGDEFVGAMADHGTRFRVLKILSKKIIISDAQPLVCYTATCISDQ